MYTAQYARPAPCPASRMKNLMLEAVSPCWRSYFISNFKFFSSGALGEDKGTLIWDQPFSAAMCWRCLGTHLMHYGIYLGDNRGAYMMPDILLALTDDKGLMQKVVSNKLPHPSVTGGQHLCGHLWEDFAYGTEILVNHLTDPQEEGTAQRRGYRGQRSRWAHNSLLACFSHLRAFLATYS